MLRPCPLHATCVGLVLRRGCTCLGKQRQHSDRPMVLDNLTQWVAVATLMPQQLPYQRSRLHMPQLSHHSTSSMAWRVGEVF
jgi:hypothetical protein